MSLSMVMADEEVEVEGEGKICGVGKMAWWGNGDKKSRARRKIKKINKKIRQGEPK